jgi:hypothetical protein
MVDEIQLSNLTNPSPFKELGIIKGLSWASSVRDIEAAMNVAENDVRKKAAEIDGCDRVEKLTFLSPIQHSGSYLIVAYGTAVNTRERNHNQYGPNDH